MNPMDKQFVIDAANPELSAFRSSIRALLSKAGFDEKKTGEVVLAVDECLTNIIRHGYKCGPGRIEVTLAFTAGCVRVSVKDYGPKFNPSNQPAPKIPPETPGGLGIFLTGELMDQVVYDESFIEGNLLHMTKYQSITAA